MFKKWQNVKNAHLSMKTFHRVEKHVENWLVERMTVVILISWKELASNLLKLNSNLQN